jgi:hypothetical protein
MDEAGQVRVWDIVTKAPTESAQLSLGRPATWSAPPQLLVTCEGAVLMVLRHSPDGWQCSLYSLEMPGPNCPLPRLTPLVQQVALPAGMQRLPQVGGAQHRCCKQLQLQLQLQAMRSTPHNIPMQATSFKCCLIGGVQHLVAFLGRQVVLHRLAVTGCSSVLESRATGRMGLQVRCCCTVSCLDQQ